MPARPLTPGPAVRLPPLRTRARACRAEPTPCPARPPRVPCPPTPRALPLSCCPSAEGDPRAAGVDPADDARARQDAAGPGAPRPAAAPPAARSPARLGTPLPRQPAAFVHLTPLPSARIPCLLLLALQGAAPPPGYDPYRDQRIKLGGLAEHLESIRAGRRIVFVACGTSHHAALAARRADGRGGGRAGVRARRLGPAKAGDGGGRGAADSSALDMLRLCERRWRSWWRF